MLTKRWIAIFLCLLLLFSLAACHIQTPATDPSSPTGDTQDPGNNSTGDTQAPGDNSTGDTQDPQGPNDSVDPDDPDDPADPDNPDDPDDPADPDDPDNPDNPADPDDPVDPPVDPDYIPPEPVTSFTQAELDAIEAFLNDPVNNGFVHHNEYSAPNKTDLFDVFYDGSGISIPLEQWAPGEAEAVLAATGWESFYNPPTKITREAANAFLLEKCGLTLADFEGEIRGFRYVEAYDAFYHIHGDLNFSSVTVIGGGLDADGRCIVHYTALRPAVPADCQLHPTRHTVTLLKIDSGYQFVANVKNPTPTETDLEAIEAFLNDPANADLLSDSENPFPADASVTVLSGELDADGQYIIQYDIDSRNFTLTLLKTDSGYEVVSNLENIPLTEEELKSLEEYLNQLENRGFWGSNQYTSPEKIDLMGVFYDGAGIASSKDKWAEGELEAVIAATGWSFLKESPDWVPHRIPRAAANALLLEKIGLTLDDLGGEIPRFTYVEATDAYYSPHSDLYNGICKPTSGVRNEEGLYILQYGSLTLTMQKTDTGFRFLSNVHHRKPSSDVEEPLLSVLTDGASYYSTSRKEEVRLTDHTVDVNEYAVVDLDGDGEMEVVVQWVSKNYEAIILRNVNGSVIGYDLENWYHGPYTDGIYCWHTYSTETSYVIGYSAIRFSGDQCEFTELCRVEQYIGSYPYSYTYYVDGKPASKAEYLAIAEAERERVDWLRWFML